MKATNKFTQRLYNFSEQCHDETPPPYLKRRVMLAISTIAAQHDKENGRTYPCVQYKTGKSCSISATSDANPSPNA